MASSEEQDRSLLVSHELLLRLSGELASEWKHLGRKLGLSDGKLYEIETDNSGNVKNAKYQMLISWKQRKGGEATHNSLAEALIEVGRKDLSEKVQHGNPALKRSIECETFYEPSASLSKRYRTPDGSSKNRSSDEEHKRCEFVAYLKLNYQNQYDSVQPIPYIRDRLYCVDRVFVEGGIQYLVASKMHGPDVWDDMKSYQDIVKDSRFQSSLRILEGDPGYGKSTITLQIAYDWCNSKPDSYLYKFEILILIQLGLLHGVTSIYSAIKQFLLPSDSAFSEDDVKHIIRNSSSVLVVLDSFDEYPDQDNQDSDISKIIRRNMFHNFVVVVTTRTACRPKYLAPTAQWIRLTGFDEKARDEYIRKAVVGDDDEAAGKIKRRLEVNYVLAGICQIPLVFVLFAHMSHETDLLEKFKSVTHFFGYMIGCFHDHLHNKRRQAVSEVPSSVVVNHEKLDETAFSALRKQVQQPFWEKNKLCEQIGKECYEVYKQLGILAEEEILDIDNYSGIYTSSKPIQKKTTVRFYHKLFHEWFAAQHLSKFLSSNEFPDDSPTNRCGILEELDPVDLQYLFRFSCGLKAGAADKIIEFLERKLSAKRFAVLCLLEREGDVGRILETLRDLCNDLLQFSEGDSLLLQRSTIDLLQIASSHEISISSVWLRNCYSTVDLSDGNHLQLKSNLSIPVLTTLNKLTIQTPLNEGREITAKEFTGILQYSSKCLALKELKFQYSLLPQYVQAEYVSILKTRNVKVTWLSSTGKLYRLNLQACLWERITLLGVEWLAAGVMTNDDYQSERKLFVGKMTGADCKDEASTESYNRLKEDITFLLQRDECLKLTEFFRFSKSQVGSVEGSNIPTKEFLFILESEGVMHPSNVSPLQEALAKLGVNSTCYNKIVTYQTNISETTPFERFVTDLSSHINSLTAKDLCDYFQFPNERKDNILSSQNPGLSLLLALQQTDDIKQTDVHKLEAPFEELKLVQAKVKVKEYQSIVSKTNDSLPVTSDWPMAEMKGLFIECLKRKLEYWYEAMTPVPWKKSCKWKSSELFVGGGLIVVDSPSIKGQTSVDKKCKLQYTEIFSHQNFVSERRIILEGDPGCGKTMLTAQLAYDWSQNKLQNVDVLIWLPLKFVRNKTLIEAIKEFYIPKDNPLRGEDIEEVLSRETDVIAVLLDGLEEYSCIVKEGDASEVVKVFNGNKHPNWKVVLTCRSDYSHNLPKCPRLKVGLFGDDERKEYIKKLCAGDHDMEKQNEIETFINQNPFILDVCSVPLLFVLAVHNIRTGGAMNEDHCERIGPFMKSMISTLITEETLEDEIGGPSLEYSASEKLYLGEVAFNGMCKGRQQLIWERKFLESNVVNCRRWIESGVLVIEDNFAEHEEKHGEISPFEEDDSYFSKHTAKEENSLRTPVEKRASLSEATPKHSEERKANISREKLENQREETYVENPSFEEGTSIASEHTAAEVPLTMAPKDEIASLSGTTLENKGKEKRITNRKYVPQGVKFLHKVIQEWFAAAYFSNMMNKCNNSVDFNTYVTHCLTLINPIDLHYLLRFSCFLHPPFCHTIMKHLLRQFRCRKEIAPETILNCVFLCFFEHHGLKDTDLMQVVSDVCKETINIHSQNSRILQRAKSTFLNYASQCRIRIPKLLLTDIFEGVTGTKMNFSCGISMNMPDTVRSVEVTRWDLRLKEEQTEEPLQVLTRGKHVRKIVCFFPLQPPKNLTEETKKRICDNKIIVQWKIGEKANYVYDSKEHKFVWTDAEDPVLNELEKYKFEELNQLETTTVVPKNGCMLTIPGTGVELFIPPNVFKDDAEDQTVTIKILPRRALHETSKCFEDHSTVVVEILPNKLILPSAAKLILPHCLKIRNPQNCQVRVFQSHHDPEEIPDWQDISSSVSCVLYHSVCEINLHNFCWVKYKLRCGDEVEGKMLYVYATGNECQENDDLACVEVGYYEDLPEEGKCFWQNKRKYAVSQKFLFFKEPADEDLQIKLIKISPTCWNPAPRTAKIPYGDIQFSEETRRSFCFERTIPATPLSFCQFEVSKGDKKKELSLILKGNNTGAARRPGPRSGKVTDEDCNKISQHLTERDWKIVARFLELNEPAIEQISSDHKGNIREMSFQMLQKWKRAKGNVACYTVLKEALQKAERTDLAENLSTSQSEN